MASNYSVQKVVIERSIFDKRASKIYFGEDEQECRDLAMDIYNSNNDIRMWDWEDFDTIEEARNAMITGFERCEGYVKPFVKINVLEVFKNTYDDDGDLLDSELVEVVF